MPCGSLRSALRPSAMLRHAPCLAASIRYDRHRILPSWRRRTIGTLRAEGQMRPIPGLQRFSRRELIPPPRPAVQEPAALPNGQKEGGLAIHTVLLCLFGRSATWGNACAAPSSSPESGTCRSLRLPNRPFFDRNRPFPRHGRGSPSQPPLLMACARAARISSACVQHQTEGPMRAHRRQMQGRRRSRGGTKQGGARSRRTFRERQNVSCCAPSARRTSPRCTRNPLFRREAPPCTPITFEAAELATITCQQARLASGKRPRLTPPAASLR